jgi:hypothetical protein
MDRWEHAREMNSRSELKAVVAESEYQKLAESEMYRFIRNKVEETMERLIYWESLLLEEVRKGGGTMGYKVGALKKKQIELKEYLNSIL